MLETIARTTEDGGVGLSSLIVLLGAFLGLLRTVLFGHGARRERRETLERMLDLQRQVVRQEQRAARAEGVARVLRATLVLLVALLALLWFGVR